MRLVRAVIRSLAVLLLLAAAASQAEPPRSPSDVIGALVRHEIVSEDTLADLAILYQVGYIELVAANPGIDPWLPPPGVHVVIPRAHVLPDAPRRGIVINLADQRLYLFRARREPISFPIGIGSEAVDLRVGVTRVVRKRTRPTWNPPPSLREENPDLPVRVPPGPDNPLGAYALDLGWPRIVVHGTNRPYGVGRRVSHGCIRLHDAHIAILHELVAVGTEVRFVNQPAKLGWAGDELFLEVHPTVQEAIGLEDVRVGPAEPIEDLDERVRRAAGTGADRVDWFAVRYAATMRMGIPVRIVGPAVPGAVQEPVDLR